MISSSQTPPLAGYLNRISARPGERIVVYASSELPGHVRAEVVRIWNADANPEGMGINVQLIENLAVGSFLARKQQVTLGGWGQVPARGLFADPVNLVSFRFQPWLTRDAGSALVAYTSPPGTSIWSLVVKPGRIEIHAEGEILASAAIELKRKRWYEVALRFDMREGGVELLVENIDGSQHAEASGTLKWTPSESGELYFAAHVVEGQRQGHFNGKLESVTVRAEGASGPVRALWDFSLALDSVALIDVGPLALHGKLGNLPTRGVRSSTWDGTEMAFVHAPNQYSAVHFHEDDIYDCEWSADTEFEIPDDLPSGVYGVRLTQDAYEDIIPFFVLPPRGTRTAKVCYLAATFTYMAYGNHVRRNLDAVMEARIRDWGTPRGPDNYPGFGASTYNFHPDGSGTCFSSRLRPLLTMRPGFLTFAIHEGSGIRHFPADGHLVEWFAQRHIDIDVITDEDLHREGIELIKDYDVLVTGSHPEYHTTETIDALKTYTRRGGNLCYLGGNGFYWRIAVSDKIPGVMEVRRAEGGIRAWATEAGEGYQVLDGQYGGLWRRNGRAPQEIGGVGFSAQGLMEGSYYRRTDMSFHPDYSWIFTGVDEEKIGDYGFSGGGAAGFELDRADFELGTPEGTVVLARSEGHGPSFMCVPEEVLSHLKTTTGEPARDLVRAEIAYVQLPGGGQIFATGSITFCGSLPVNGFSNGCSTMLENVIRRFMGPAG